MIETALPSLEAMLREFKEVRAEEAALRRRWFEDDVLELIVWYDAMGLIEGYQLCYPGPDLLERALTWRPETGFTHARVDSGDQFPEKNLTPVLVSGGQKIPWETLRREFTNRSKEIEEPLRRFILDTIERRPA